MTEARCVIGKEIGRGISARIESVPNCRLHTLTILVSPYEPRMVTLLTEQLSALHTLIGQYLTDLAAAQATCAECEAINER